jgi:dTDP-4-amino-4,6-dideoxygalactose transaminase
VSKRPITVTQPFLPPLEEFIPYLEEIWETRSLTNAGPFHRQLEIALAEYLGVAHIALFANGTLALLTALKALALSGEVITTPFSFVATTHALLWSGIAPVFADIDPNSFNIAPKAIEAAITPRTTAILAVHVYGRPCDVRAIQNIARTHDLKVIYDAAHAFAVRDGGGSVTRHGDLSVLSFHATKVFTTFEGGAIVCHDPETKQRIDLLKNFGFADEVTVLTAGINGKMNEAQAAFGLLQLRYIDAAIHRRREIDAFYRRALENVPDIDCPPLPPDTIWNHAYFPILVQPDYPLSRDGLYDLLREHGIHARRYFYPLISEFPMYRGLSSAAPARLPVAHDIAKRVLCLPIYPTLGAEEMDEIIDMIAQPVTLAANCQKA